MCAHSHYEMSWKRPASCLFLTQSRPHSLEAVLQCLSVRRARFCSSPHETRNLFISLFVCFFHFHVDAMQNPARLFWFMNKDAVGRNVVWCNLTAVIYILYLHHALSYQGLFWKIYMFPQPCFYVMTLFGLWSSLWIFYGPLDCQQPAISAVSHVPLSLI